MWNLIGNAHNGESGSWREAVVRQTLRRHLPSTVHVGTGFIVDRNRTSPQIDVLLHDASYPTLFRQGDTVIVTPDAVRGVIEVKSSISTYGDHENPRADSKSLIYALDHLGRCGELIGGKDQVFLGLFSYEYSLTDSQRVVDTLPLATKGNADRICLLYTSPSPRD